MQGCENQRLPPAPARASGTTTARCPHGPNPVGRAGTLQPLPLHKCRGQSAEARVLPSLRCRKEDVPGRDPRQDGAVPVLLVAAARVRRERARRRDAAQFEGQRGRDHQPGRLQGDSDASHHGVGLHFAVAETRRLALVGQ